MANAFVTEEIVFFDQVLEKFEPNNITARQVDKFKPEMQSFERSSLQVFKPAPYISRSKRGLTLVDADYKNTTQLAVPSTLNNSDDPDTSNIHSVAFTMNAFDLNDPVQLTKKAESAVQALAAIIDNLTAREVANKGSLVIADTVSGGLSKYEQYTAAEVAMINRDVPLMRPRTLILNPTDYNLVSGNLAQRDAVPTGVSLTAFEKSMIPRISTFDSFKANFMPSLDAAAGSGFLVNGNQSFQPTATDSNGNNVDNRTMAINVDTGTGTEKAGDAFTIAGINALSAIHKNNFGELQTFRIVSVDTAGSVWTITPPIITNNSAATITPGQAEEEYANCSDEANDNAVITFINTVDAQTNIFFDNSAVELIHGSLSKLELNGSGVASSVRATESGIELIFARETELNDFSTKYRLTAWFNPNVLIPEMCGILIGKQT